MSGFFTFGSQGSDEFTLAQLPPALGPNGALLVELPAGALPLAVTIPTPVPVTDNGGSLTVDDGGLSLTIDGTVSISGTVPVSIALPVTVQDGGGSLTVDAVSWPLPTGAATEATLAALNAKVVAVDTGAVVIASLPNEGQQTMANSISVAIASNQSAVPISDGGGSVTVDGTVGISGTVPVSIAAAVTVQDGGGSITVDGTVATNAERTEDTQHASGHIGVFVLGVRNDTAAALTNQNGDYSPFAVDSAGRVLVASIATAVPVTDNGGSLTVDGTVSISGTVTVDTELPAAAALSDTIGNPTTPMVGAAGMLWTGSVWVRHPGSVADGALVNLGANNDVHGTVAHDGADSGNPVKVGGQAVDYEPDTGGEQGRTEVAAADRADLAVNLRGEQVPAVKPERDALSNIGTTYNNSTVTATSQELECWQYRQATLSFELTKANAPTDIRLDVEVSLDGTNYAKLMNGPLSSLVYSNAAIGAGGIKRAITFPIGAYKVRVVVTATGTTASNTITVANPVLYFRT